MNMNRGLGKWVLMTIMAVVMTIPASAQKSRKLITPITGFGLAFNADTNHPLFSGSLRATMEIGEPSDFLKLSFGAGYRGYFDRNPPYEFIRNASFSDYMLYSKDNGETKNVRPVGGQVIVPVEAYLRVVPLGDDFYLSLGCGLEYGIRLYQSKRYGRYYGDHIMNPSCFSFYPLIAIEGDMDEATFSASLYWRHNTESPFNYKNLYNPEKFDDLNYIGFQLSVCFEL